MTTKASITVAGLDPTFEPALLDTTVAVAVSTILGISILAVCYYAVVIAAGKMIESRIQARKPADEELPSLTLLVPANDEEAVVEGLLDDLVELVYPDYEVILADDASTDSTPEIFARYCDRHPTLFSQLSLETNQGKPAAINAAARRASGEILGVLDADTRLRSPADVRRIASAFVDSDVSAVQGELATPEKDGTLVETITRAARDGRNLYKRGKAALGLFVPLDGTNQFVRRSLLRRIGYWNTDAMVEDIDLSVRIYGQGERITYLPIPMYHPAPPTLQAFFAQRTRWVRGHLHALEVARATRGRWRFDWADMYVHLLSPSLSLSILLGGLILVVDYALLPTEMLAGPFELLMQFSDLMAVLTISFLAVSVPPRIFGYVLVAWVVESVASLYAHVLELLRAQRGYVGTSRES